MFLPFGHLCFSMSFLKFKPWIVFSKHVLYYVTLVTIPRSCPTPSCTIFAATPFWIGFKKTRAKLFFQDKIFFWKDEWSIFSVHFIANPTANFLKVYYVSVALKLTILELGSKKLELSCDFWWYRRWGTTVLHQICTQLKHEWQAKTFLFIVQS